MSEQTVPSGTPCWYELTTTDLDGAKAFYDDVLGWQTAEASVMEGFDYRLAGPNGTMVAGMMSNAETGAPPSWLIYFTAANADDTVAHITAAGGAVLRPAADIPGTGRFAVVADPQGAAFGVLQPDTAAPPQGGSAFDQKKPGHGNWHELMSRDPQAAMGFYGDLFGWGSGQAMDMGEMGTYQIFSHQGTDIGGIMGLGNAPMPMWMPYFGVDGVTEAISRIESGGGTVFHGPAEVPGGAHIAAAVDPQGAHFAVVGPLSRD